MPTPDKQLCSLRTAQQVYEREFAHCQRSPEWKAGALRGLRLAAGLAPAASPYASGTAQDDAWGSGSLAGAAEWKWRAERGQLPGQPGWAEQA